MGSEENFGTAFLEWVAGEVVFGQGRCENGCLPLVDALYLVMSVTPSAFGRGYIEGLKALPFTIPLVSRRGCGLFWNGRVRTCAVSLAGAEDRPNRSLSSKKASRRTTMVNIVMLSGECPTPVTGDRISLPTTTLDWESKRHCWKENSCVNT